MVAPACLVVCESEFGSVIATVAGGMYEYRAGNVLPNPRFCIGHNLRNQELRHYLEVDCHSLGQLERSPLDGGRRNSGV